MTLPTKTSLALLPWAALLTAELSAQRTYDQDQMAANLAEMQAQPWCTGGGWITDFDAAKAQAKATGRPIFAYFTCTHKQVAACKDLEDRVFSTEEFQAWAKQNIVPFAAVVTMIEGRKDDKLALTYGFKKAPSMAILDASGEAIAKEIPLDLFLIKTIVAATPDYLELSAAYEADQYVEASAWFMARLGMGKLDAAEARELLALTRLGDEARAKAEEILLVLEMTELSRKVVEFRELTRRGRDGKYITRRDRGRNYISRRDREKMEELLRLAPEMVYDAFKAGKRLPKNTSAQVFVDTMLIAAWRRNGDKEAFLYAYDRYRARAVKRFERQLADSKRRLERHNLPPRQVQERHDTARQAMMKQLEELDAIAEKLKR